MDLKFHPLFYKNDDLFPSQYGVIMLLPLCYPLRKLLNFPVSLSVILEYYYLPLRVAKKMKGANILKASKSMLYKCLLSKILNVYSVTPLELLLNF